MRPHARWHKLTPSLAFFSPADLHPSSSLAGLGQRRGDSVAGFPPPGARPPGLLHVPAYKGGPLAVTRPPRPLLLAAMVVIHRIWPRQPQILPWGLWIRASSMSRHAAADLRWQCILRDPSSWRRRRLSARSSLEAYRSGPPPCHGVRRRTSGGGDGPVFRVWCGLAGGL